MSKRSTQTGRTNKLPVKRQKMEEVAPFINFVQFLCTFKDVLEECIQDIKIESSEALYMGYSHIEWADHTCVKCMVEIRKAEEYLKHILECQFLPGDLNWYNKYQVIPKEVKEVMSKAQEIRASKSFLTKNFLNTPDFSLKVPINSRLTPFLTKGLSVYIDKMPSDLKKVVPASVTVDGKVHDLYFTTVNLEKQREEVMKIKAEHEHRRLALKLRRMCTKFTMGIPDIVLDADSRTTEETACLARALRVSKTRKEPIQKLIMEKIEEMKPRREESGEKELVEPKNGAKEAEEEMAPFKQPRQLKNQLVSAFTTDFLKPATAKRISVKTKRGE